MSLKVGIQYHYYHYYGQTIFLKHETGDHSKLTIKINFIVIFKRLHFVFHLTKVSVG
jgi:hypothetical protein